MRFTFYCNAHERIRSKGKKEKNIFKREKKEEEEEYV